MQVQIILETENPETDAIQLNDFIKELNIKELISNVEESQTTNGTMSVGEYLPIINLLLTSTVSSVFIKGIFDVIKNYFDIKKANISSSIETKKIEAEINKVTITIENDDGIKKSMSFSTFNEDERTKFFEIINSEKTGNSKLEM
jgi:hypothetical protein